VPRPLQWGYVIAERMRVVFDDREEIYEAGDAFYQPPGHRPYADAATEVRIDRERGVCATWSDGWQRRDSEGHRRPT
jgi:hypothetical protein